MPDVQEGFARPQALPEDSVLTTGPCLYLSARKGTLSLLQRHVGVLSLESRTTVLEAGLPGCYSPWALCGQRWQRAEEHTEALQAALGEDPSPKACLTEGGSSETGDSPPARHHLHQY